jgi:hypothetical protein
MGRNGGNRPGPEPKPPVKGALAMLTVTTRSRADKPPATQTTLDLSGRLLTIVKGGAVKVYELDEFSTSWDGRAFFVKNLSNGERYESFVAVNGQDHLCSCKGFESCGHCCHTDSLLELWRAGWLERPEAGAA